MAVAAPEAGRHAEVFGGVDAAHGELVCFAVRLHHIVALRRERPPSERGRSSHLHSNHKVAWSAAQDHDGAVLAAILLIGGGVHANSAHWRHEVRRILAFFVVVVSGVFQGLALSLFIGIVS